MSRIFKAGKRDPNKNVLALTRDEELPVGFRTVVYPHRTPDSRPRGLRADRISVPGASVSQADAGASGMALSRKGGRKVFCISTDDAQHTIGGVKFKAAAVYLSLDGSGKPVRAAMIAGTGLEARGLELSADEPASCEVVGARLGKCEGGKVSVKK